MFNYTYGKRWKPALIIGFSALVIGYILAMHTPLVNTGFIIMLVIPFFSFPVAFVSLFVNTIYKVRDKNIEKTIPNADNVKYVYDALNNGSAQKYDNERIVITEEGIFALTDTADFYYFDKIESISATNHFGEQYLPKMQFIRLDMKESNKNSHRLKSSTYYIAITEKRKVKDTYEPCVKACQAALERYNSKYAVGENEA